MLDAASVLQLALVGAVTFVGVFLGARLAARRERYARHVDQLKERVVEILERWVNEINVHFETYLIAYRTLQEDDRKELEGFERRHYWDVPEIFGRPWDQRDIHRLELAGQHWPDLHEWERIRELGELTYSATGVVHHALVHMWDKVSLPQQPRDVGRDHNLGAATPGQQARALLADALIRLRDADPSELFGVHRCENGWGVHFCGHLVAVLPTEEDAEQAARGAAEGLAFWRGPDAARAVHERGQELGAVAARLQESLLDLYHEADATGWCTGCRRVAPKGQRIQVAWGTFHDQRSARGLREALRDARRAFVRGPRSRGTTTEDRDVPT